MDRDPELRMIGFYVMRGHDHEKLMRLSKIEQMAYSLWMEQHYEAEEKRYRQLLGGR